MITNANQGEARRSNGGTRIRTEKQGNATRSKEEHGEAYDERSVLKYCVMKDRRSGAIEAVPVPVKGTAEMYLPKEAIHLLDQWGVGAVSFAIRWRAGAGGRQAR